MSLRKRSSNTRVLPTILGVIVVVALIAVAGEIGVRMYTTKQIADGFRESSAERGVVQAEDPAVVFGSRPLLLALATKNQPKLTLTTPDTLVVNNQAALGGTPEIIGDPSAVIDLNDVDLSDSNHPVAATIHITVTLPPELIQALINRETDLRVSSLQPLPAEGLFNVEFSSGFVTSKVRPTADGGRILINLVGGSLMNLNLDSLAQWFGQATGNLLSYEIGHGLQVANAQVTDGGLALTLTGSHIALPTVTEITFH